MNHRSTLHLAALSAAVLLSANFTAASAKDRTAYDPGTDDSPMAKSGICNIEGDGNTGGGLVQDGNSGESTGSNGIVQQQAQAENVDQLGASAVRKAEVGTEDAAT
ncbi:MAG: hypothetical protein ACEQSB_01445 [Undibacterium sp.]